MIPRIVYCGYCGAQNTVKTWRKFTVCPYCGSRTPFSGFEYRQIDPYSSMYANVKYWMDCPACRSKNMYRGTMNLKWKCPDCGYSISEIERLTGVLWFCDDCEAYLNVQPGFTTHNKVWKCTECGYVSDVTINNIY